MPWNLRDKTIFPEALVKDFDRMEAEMNQTFAGMKVATAEPQTMMVGATVRNFDISMIWPCSVVDPETFDRIFEALTVAECQVIVR